MRAFIIFAFFGSLLPHGCQTVPKPPPPAHVASEPALGAASDKQGSKAAAAVHAATKANESNAAGPAQTATAGELSVAAANLPLPGAADDAEALQRVNNALTGKLAEAQQDWTNARSEAAGLTATVKDLKAQVEAQKIAAADELQRQLTAARDEERKKAATEQRHMVGWIFYGGAFLLGAAGAVVLGTAQYVPLFGPKLAISLAISAAASAVLGVLINELLANPWIVRTLFGLLVAGIAAAVGIGIANHNHITSPPKVAA